MRQLAAGPTSGEYRVACVGRAYRRLMDAGLYPVASGIPLSERILFYRQLAALVGAGIPIGSALGLRAERTRNTRLRRILAATRRDVQAGSHLSDALAAHGSVFCDLQIGMIRAGEASGQLGDALSSIADYLEREMDFRRLMRGLTLYPKITVVVGLFVIPAVFALIGGKSVGDAVVPALLSLLSLGFLALVIVAAFRICISRSQAAATEYERAKWLLPGIGAAVRKFAMSKFGRAFAALYAAGLSPPAALRLAGYASGSVILGDAAERAAKDAELGIRLSESLRRTGVFSVDMLDMVETGELSGEMDAMASKVADHLAGEAENRAQLAAFVVSQVLYLIVALYVLGALRLPAIGLRRG